MHESESACFHEFSGWGGGGVSSGPPSLLCPPGGNFVLGTLSVRTLEVDTLKRRVCNQGGQFKSKHYKEFFFFPSTDKEKAKIISYMCNSLSHSMHHPLL